MVYQKTIESVKEEHSQFFHKIVDEKKANNYLNSLMIF